MHGKGAIFEVIIQSTWKMNGRQSTSIKRIMQIWKVVGSFAVHFPQVKDNANIEGGW